MTRPHYVPLLASDLRQLGACHNHEKGETPMTRKPTTPAARRRARLRAMWQRAIDAKEQGGIFGLCTYAEPNHYLSEENEIHRMRDVFGNGESGFRRPYLWSRPGWDFDYGSPDPDETARIIAAVIMRETVT